MRSPVISLIRRRCYLGSLFSPSYPHRDVSFAEGSREAHAGTHARGDVFGHPFGACANLHAFVFDRELVCTFFPLDRGYDDTALCLFSQVQKVGS